ncbi:response regulator transcription factor [Micromonospora sagamiensis]|uniref:LuxR family two component transcriptional regulator n=1 Tax=Micromonospora sagamiensis TaxID=47875 RepID=A0A562WHF1_9ACTN|nr:response regulator transcription factor [Micromonospora sagamiensis]TWJ29615.1 LuxR family two component transcriptional regulator [Micromonospora sagamiensis]BCL17356.1 DNA-binding response regulator [Micromonospora sagamiensis]
MIRVLLVDDQQLIRAGLRMLCDAQPDIEVVGEAGNGRDAVSLAARLVPDVVVMDLRMPGVDGITATSRILADRPGTRVLVLTTFGDDDHLYPALTAGACGFLLKDAPPTELLDGIRRAAAGDSPFSPDVLRRLVRRAVHAQAGTPRPVDGLTSREQDVLDLVAEGLSNTEIAERLHIGVTTVKTHITSLMAKTNSPNRVRLALFARGV